MVFISEESRNRPLETTRPIPQATELPPSEDNWDDDNENSKAKPYVIPGLSREAEVKEEGDNKDKAFRIKSNIEIQAMQPAQRKKYYKELAERARNKMMPELTHKTRTIKLHFSLFNSLINLIVFQR